MFRNEKKDRIEMNISADTLRMVVRTLYTGKTEINIDNVQDMLEASNYLQIKDLNEKCVDFMARNLDVSNCVEVLVLADQLSVDRLLQEAINYIGEHFQKLFETSEEFKQLPVELGCLLLADSSASAGTNFSRVQDTCTELLHLVLAHPESSRTQHSQKSRTENQQKCLLRQV